jgi:hypothetical protein
MIKVAPPNHYKSNSGEVGGQTSCGSDRLKLEVTYLRQ